MQFNHRQCTNAIDRYYLDQQIDTLKAAIEDGAATQKLLNIIEDLQSELDTLYDTAYDHAETLDTIRCDIQEVL